MRTANARLIPGAALMPSFVISNAHASTRTAGNPMAATAMIVCIAQSGALKFSSARSKNWKLKKYAMKLPELRQLPM